MECRGIRNEWRNRRISDEVQFIQSAPNNLGTLHRILNEKENSPRIRPTSTTWVEGCETTASRRERTAEEGNTVRTGRNENRTQLII